MGKEMDDWVVKDRSKRYLGSAGVCTKICPPWDLYQRPAGAESPLASFEMTPCWDEELIQGRADAQRESWAVGNTKIFPSAHIQVHMHIFKKGVGQRK